MLYSSYGVKTNPRQLNDYLSKNGGYTRSGLLKWKPCAAYSRGRARLVYNGDADAARLERELSGGNPVIVKVRLPSKIFHWVLVVGKRGEEYLVNDPLGDEEEAVGLSRFGEVIYSMRIFRKVEG
jgi:hypothetical protein